MISIDFARPTVAARLLAACLSLACAATAAPTITNLNLGALPGRFSRGVAISDDGAAAAGLSISTTGMGNRAFRWTSAGGQQLLGALPAQIDSSGLAISADGGTVVGYSGNPAPDLAFRWTQAGGMTALAMPPTFTRSLAQGVSRDGSVVVGAMYTAQTSRAFRWTASGGAQDLGVLPGQLNSSAAAVSRDGSAVAGNSGDRIFRWLTGVGMQDLGALAGTNGMYASAISADGTTVVGAGSYQFTSRAFRWTGADGVQDLHDSPFGLQVSGGAYAVSGNGSVIVGWAQSSTITTSAFLWTRASGMVDLNDYLVGVGLDLTGWTQIQALGISADATALVGTGYYNGFLAAFVIRGLPRDCRADVTGDGRVDFADLNRVLAEYGTTCP